LLSLANHWAFKRPIELVRNQSQRLDDLEQRFSLSLSQYVTTRKERLHRLQTNLTALDPSSVLRRGYSITRQLPGRTVLRDSHSVVKGHRISVTLHQGEIEAEVQTVH
jgi:exodeoxyribonuclease VII large subunit